jgi:hypothetical protein
MQEIMQRGFTPIKVDKKPSMEAYLEILEWLRDNVGGLGLNSIRTEDEDLYNWGDVRWYSQVWYGYYTYWFKDPSVATIFNLRWA